MTNLEYVCQELRRIGRADAAQILEMRSLAEWEKASSNWAIIQLQRADPEADRRGRGSRETPAQIVDHSMCWRRTKEGTEYWQNVVEQLQGECA